jgi:hypothetical protein
VARTREAIRRGHRGAWGHQAAGAAVVPMFAEAERRLMIASSSRAAVADSARRAGSARTAARVLVMARLRRPGPMELEMRTAVGATLVPRPLVVAEVVLEVAKVRSDRAGSDSQTANSAWLEEEVAAVCSGAVVAAQLRADCLKYRLLQAAAEEVVRASARSRVSSQSPASGEVTERSP